MLKLLFRLQLGLRPHNLAGIESERTITLRSQEGTLKIVRVIAQEVFGSFSNPFSSVFCNFASALSKRTSSRSSVFGKVVE